MSSTLHIHELAGREMCCRDSCLRREEGVWGDPEFCEFAFV